MTCRTWYALALPLSFLDVDPGITDPWRLEDRMAGAGLTGLPEIRLAHFPEVGETDVCRLAPHPFDDFSGIGHVLNGINIGTTRQIAVYHPVVAERGVLWRVWWETGFDSDRRLPPTPASVSGLANVRIGVCYAEPSQNLTTYCIMHSR
jgi:hypothetical protein